MKHYYGKSISAVQNPQKKLTSDDREEVIWRSRKWKWPLSSKRLLIGPGCLWTKMFSVAQLIKVHLDLWPRLTFRGHFKVTNVKIAYIFLMVRDKHVVIMKHYWKVDIWLSDSVTRSPAVAGTADSWPQINLLGGQCHWRCPITSMISISHAWYTMQFSLSWLWNNPVKVIQCQICVWPWSDP